MTESPYNFSGDSSDIMSTNSSNITSKLALLERYADMDEFYAFHRPEISAADKYVTPVWYIVGLTGNTLAFIVWVQRRMRHSSGVYLAALAMSDLIFLCLHILFELQSVWKIPVLLFPVLCEVYPIIFMTSQYLSPLLVLGFTVERYISICHPFQREKYCTVRRAVMVVIAFVVFILLLNSIQGYFWVYTKGDCSPRVSVLVGGAHSLWSVWTWFTEMLIFALVPLAVLFFNILVIQEARKLSRNEQTRLQLKRGGKKSATTVMLLAVSFYLILTTLPVTICYALYFSFPEGKKYLTDQEIDKDTVWLHHFTYRTVRSVVQEIGMSHYACNFCIYLVTGKVFRKELKRLAFMFFCKKDYMFHRYEYESELQTTRDTVRANGSLL